MIVTMTDIGQEQALRLFEPAPKLEKLDGESLDDYTTRIKHAYAEVKERNRKRFNLFRDLDWAREAVQRRNQEIAWWEEFGQTALNKEMLRTFTPYEAILEQLYSLLDSEAEYYQTLLSEEAL